jgi:shikimate dehydrogenase
VIRGTTRLLPLIGDPIAQVKSPMIYNPYFEQNGIDAVVVPMGVSRDDFPDTLRAMFRVANTLGALITMPHKQNTIRLLDDCSERVHIAGSCNAILRRPDGTLFGDLFDGIGFVKALARNGFQVTGSTCLVVGAGGAGCAIATALAEEGAGELAICDVATARAEALIARLRMGYPRTAVRADSNDPSGFDLVVNASPLGMAAGDQLPVDILRLQASTFVADVVLKPAVTPLLGAARERGCRIQPGVDMLFEQIPLYLDLFGLGQASSDELRALAKLT